ncbi:MAG: hypothetical protein ACRYHA_06300 [Janthinobacterium lividum]
MTGMSAAALAGSASWLLPLLVLAALALCVMRARQRQRRRRQRELASAARDAVASEAAVSSTVERPAVMPAAAASSTVERPAVKPVAAASSTVARSAAMPSVASLLTAATPAASVATPSADSVPTAPSAPAAPPASTLPAASVASAASTAPAPVSMPLSRAAGQGRDPVAAQRTGRDAGRREVETLETLRGLEFGDREEAALQAQLARAPRDVGALFGLLQWHARRGERTQVESFAHALWDETDAEGELWRRAAVLGRSVDPENPLYSTDPFAALAEHATRQSVRAPLALDAFDLSLPDADEKTAPSASTPVAADAAVAVDSAPHAAGTPPAVFDFLNAPTARLPASFAGLDLNLDGPDETTVAAAADRPRLGGRRDRKRAKGAPSTDA